MSWTVLPTGSWTIVIPRVPKSLNVRLRMHWAIAAQEKKEWLNTLFFLTLIAGVTKATAPRVLHIERRAHGIMDEDNLAAAYKEVVVDNLKPAKFEQGICKTGKREGRPWHRSKQGLGLIVEDDPKWVKVIYTQTRIPRKEAQVTVLTIEDE